MTMQCCFKAEVLDGWIAEQILSLYLSGAIFEKSNYKNNLQKVFLKIKQGATYSIDFINELLIDTNLKK